MPKYLVETLTQFRVVYVVETDSKASAQEFVLERGEEGELEFGQDYLGQMIVSSREINDKEAIRVFDELHEYGQDWPRDHKLSYVYTLDETDE